MDIFELEELTPCELQVMKVIWEGEEPLSMQDIKARLQIKYRRNWKRETVSVYLNQLLRKGYVTAERHGRVFIYFAQADEADYRKNYIANDVEFWHNGRADEFVASFLKEQKLTDAEKKRIREIVDGLDW